MTQSSRTLRSRTLALALTAALALLPAGCRNPLEGYALVSRQAAEADGGRFSFDLNLEDSCCVYRTAVAARLNTAQLPGQSIELQMSVTSPGGQTAIERVAFPLHDVPGQVRSRRHDGGVRDFLWPWREQIRIPGPELGTWKVVITLPDAAALKAVEGIGLSYEGKPWEKAN